MPTTKSRTKKGAYRRIRKDTKISTIEKIYDLDLGVRSDKKIGTYLKEKGYPSLSSMLRDSK
jgi:hypothetical protein